MYQNIERTYIYDSIFHMLVLETFEYVFKKNIDSKQKVNELDEIGTHLGERIANHLLNTNSSSTTTKMEIDEIMKFLGKDVWIFVFGKQISKLQTNRKGTFLIDTDEIKFHHCLITDKNDQSEILEIVLAFVSGIIRGVLSTFNFDSNVVASFKSGPIVSTLLSMSAIGDKTIPNNQSQFSYSFTINLLNA